MAPSRGVPPVEKNVIEEGLQVTGVRAVLQTKLDRNAKAHNRRWLLDFGAAASSKQWVKIDQCISPSGLILEPLVVFEERRTGAKDTLQTDWHYDNFQATQGTVHDMIDGHRIYVARPDETLRDVSKNLENRRIKSTAHDLWVQNLFRYTKPALRLDSRLKGGTQIRLFKASRNENHGQQ